jgi:hypothetical protein
VTQKDDLQNNLEGMYEHSFRPQIAAAQSLSTWVIDGNHYPTWRKFLSIFENYDKKHKDWGNGWLYYNDNMADPKEGAGLCDFWKFLRACIADSKLPIELREFKKAWGVDYEPGAYSGMHSHTPGTQLTAVLFLSNAEQNDLYPLAGNLVTLQPLDHEINSITYTAKAGDCVIMDGRVWHGTYPTLNNRKVFVCDFDYEVIHWEV